MKMIDLKCPSCGAQLKAEDGLETFYCQYCGHRIILAEQSKETVRAKLITNLVNKGEAFYERRAKEADEERKAASRRVWIGILIFSIIAFLFCLAGLLMKLFGL